MASIRYRMEELYLRMIGVNRTMEKKGIPLDEVLKDYDRMQKKPFKVPYKKLKGNFVISEK